MSANHDMSTIFASFVEAGKALEEKPALLREVELHKAARDQALSVLEDHKATISTQMQEIADLKAKIAQMEASLDSASKSQTEAASKLEVILSAVKGVIGEVNAAVSLVEPEPESPKAGASAVDSSATAGSPSAESTASAMPSDGQSPGESAVPPTDATTSPTAPVAPASSDGGGDCADTSPSNPGQSAANPTASSTGGTPATAEPSSASAQSPSQQPPAPQPEGAYWPADIKR